MLSKREPGPAGKAANQKEIQANRFLFPYILDFVLIMGMGPGKSGRLLPFACIYPLHFPIIIYSYTHFPPKYDCHVKDLIKYYTFISTMHLDVIVSSNLE